MYMLPRYYSYLLLTLVLFCYPTVSAQNRVYTPAAESAERRAIINALRAPVQRELRQPVIFRVSQLKAQNDWAFLIGTPLQSSGTEINYRRTRYQRLIDEGMFDGSTIYALLRRRGSVWRVITYVIGPTDVPYVTWSQDHGAPAAIFEN